MPKSLMISHTRFLSDDDISEASSPLTGDRNTSGFCGEVTGCHMMSREGSDHVKSKAASIEAYRGRPLVSQKSLDKSCSDGESDSGCSSLYEGRHDLPAETEFSLGCPSSLSFLFDLMSQSPQRNSGRDVLDLSCDTKCSQNHEEIIYTSKLIKMKQPLPNDRRLEVSNGSHEDYCMTPSGDQHFSCSPFMTNANTTRDNNRYVFESALESKSVTKSIFPKNEVCLESSYLGNTSSNLDTVIAADTLLHLHETNYPGKTSIISSPLQLTPATHAQRKICFDNRPGDLSHESSAVPEVNYDQPIDYSQLSSRRRSEGSFDDDRHSGIISENTNDIRREQWPDDKRVQVKQLRNSSSRPQGNDHRYEFILTPQLSADGRLLLSNGNVEYDHISPVRSESERKMNGEVQHPYQTAVYPTLHTRKESGGYSTQSSPLSASPATPVNCLSDARSRISPDPSQYTRPIKSISEHDILKEDAETIYRKIAYHPKLKYLLASSQNRSSENKMGNNQNSIPAIPRRDTNTEATKDCQSGGIKRDDRVQELIQHNQLHDMYHYTDDICRDTKDTQNDTHNKEASFPSLPSQNQSGYSNLRNYSYKINIHEIESPNHIRSSSETISSMIAQISQISKTNDTTIRSGNTSSSQSISLVNRTITPNNNISCQSSLSYGPVSPAPSSFSSSPPNPNPSRDQQSALTELLFSASSRPSIDPYSCVDCGKRYSTSSNLARHRQTHRSVCDKKARKCPHCEKVYVSMPAFSMHVRTHNQGCECPHCGKKFSRPWLLQGHIRTHTGEKPFGCPQCGKSFADKSNLRAHIQTHSTEKPYVCGRCGKAFALKSYLYKHEESSCMRGQRVRH